MEWLYNWMKGIAYYYIFVSMILHVLPDSKYRQYVRFFLGLVLILVILNPLMDILHLTEKMNQTYLEELIEYGWEQNKAEMGMDGI